MATTLPNLETEREFEECRHSLLYEGGRLASYIALYRKLHERRVDRLDEMNIAPAFFQLVTEAVLSGIILWADKLFDERGQRGMFDFLIFIERRINLFAPVQLKRRKQVTDDHWMPEKDPITLETIRVDRERLKGLDCLQSFRIRRDKFQAHFDKQYFVASERLADDAPLTWG